MNIVASDTGLTCIYMGMVTQIGLASIFIGTLGFSTKYGSSSTEVVWVAESQPIYNCIWGCIFDSSIDANGRLSTLVAFHTQICRGTFSKGKGCTTGELHRRYGVSGRGVGSIVTGCAGKTLREGLTNRHTGNTIAGGSCFMTPYRT